MPSVYTHFLVARQAFLSFPPQIQEKIRPHLALYYFGAQGADFCFFYKFLRPKKGNFGSYLHRQGGYETFRLLHRFATHSPSLFAYAAGYIAHYAADATLHPYVYATAGKSLLTHSRLENALDYEYGKAYAQAAKEDYQRFFKVKLSKDEKQELFVFFAALAAKCGFPPLTKPAFFRAITLFNAYLPLSFTFLTRQNLPLLQTAFGEEYERETASIFLNICAHTRELTQTFLSAIHENKQLPKSLFDKSFLTGKSINEKSELLR